MTTAPNDVPGVQTPPAHTIPQVASWGRRLANLVIDLVIYRIAVTLLVLLLANTVFVKSLAQNPIVDWLFGLSMLFAYYFIFETALQKTPGKFITGTKVVTLEGIPPDASKIALRTLSRFVPFESISIYTGKLPENKTTWWHDRWTGTRVVRG